MTSRLHLLRTPTGLATLTNLAITGLALITGIITARALGPADRGNFALVVSALAVALVVTEFGQSNAAPVATALNPAGSADVVATSRRFMLRGTTVLIGAALVAWAALPNSDQMAPIVAVVMTGCLINAFTGPVMYAVQALEPRLWNLLRITQPLAFLSGVVLLTVSQQANLTSLAVLMAGSMLAQAMVALVCSWCLGLQGGLGDTTLRRDLARHGRAGILSGLPQALAQNADRFLLALMLTRTDVGLFAVALSVASLTQPFATAVSSIALPRVAALHDAHAIAQAARSIRTSALGSAIATGVVALIAVPLLPVLYGSEYRFSQILTLLLLPGMALRSVTSVLIACLRALDRPYAASRAQLLGMVAYLLTLVPLCALIGLNGAGLSLLLAEAMTAVYGYLLWRQVKDADRGDMRSGLNRTSE